MEEILRDSIWQFVGAILALTAIVVTIILYLTQRKIKKLSYEIISANPIVTINDKYSKNLKIFYNDSQISNLYLVILKFLNNGSIPININDFNTDLIITIEGNSSKILVAEIMETIPSELEILYEYEDTQMNIKPTLLNQKDSFKTKLLIDNYNENIKITGRIAGVNRIKEVKRRVTLNSWIAFLIGLTTSMGVTFLFRDILIISIILISIGVLLIILSLVIRRKNN